MSEVIEHHLRGGYSVTFTPLSHCIVVTVEHKNRKDYWTGFISEMSHLTISLLKSSFIRRKLWINDKTMELRVCGGLQGAGSLNSKCMKKTKVNLEPNRNNMNDRKIDTKQKSVINSKGELFVTLENPISNHECLASSSRLKSLLGVYYKPKEWSSTPNYQPRFLLENFNYEACWRNFEILRKYDSKHGYFDSNDIKFLHCLKSNIKDHSYKNPTLELAKKFRYIGCNYLNKRFYNEAKKNYDESYYLCQKLKCGQDPDFTQKVNLFLAEALNNLGLYFYAQGDYIEAEMKLEECYKIRKKYLNNYDPYLSQTFDNFCFLYENWGQFAKAETSYLELIKINKEIHKFKPQELAPLYESLGNIYINQLEFSKAEESLNESFKLRQKYFSSDQEISISYYWFGCLYRSKGEFVKAKANYDECLKYRENLPKMNALDKAEVLEELGLLYYLENNVRESEKYYIQSHNIYKTECDTLHPALASSFDNLGHICQKKQNFHEAKSHFTRSLSIREIEFKKKHHIIGKSFNNLAGLYLDIRDTYMAEIFYLKCLEIRDETFPSNHPSLDSIYRYLGVTCLEIGKYTEAEKYFSTCLEIYKTSLPSNHPEFSELFNNLAIFFQKYKIDFLKAEKYYLKVLKLRRNIYPKNHHSIALAFYNIGIFHLNQGSIDKAQENLLNCLEIYKEEPPMDESNLQRLYYNLGFFYEKMIDYSNAEKYYVKCIELKPDDILIDNCNTYFSFNQLLRFQKLKGNHLNDKYNYIRIIKINKENLPKNNINLAKFYMNLGDLFQSEHLYLNAEECFNKCLKIYQIELFINNTELKKIYNKLERFYRKTKILKKNKFNTTSKLCCEINIEKKLNYSHYMIRGGIQKKLKKITYLTCVVRKDSSTTFLNEIEFCPKTLTQSFSENKNFPFGLFLL